MASDRLRRNPKEKTVILDSSAVLMLFEFSIDLENELTRLLGNYNVIIPGPIVDEIKFLSEYGKGKKRQKAKSSLKLIKQYKIVNTKGTGDDSVLLLAQKFNGIVVTNDRKLRKRIKDASLQNIYLRGKKILALN
jgi:rRNA-processing protein FCF1